MLTFMLSSWGFWLSGFFCGGVLTYGIGYDACFKNKIKVERDGEYLMLHKQELFDMAKQDLQGKWPYDKPISKEYVKKSRQMAVKVGVHHDC